MAYAINSEVIDLMLCFVRLLKNGSLFLDAMRKDQWNGMFCFVLFFQIQEYQTIQTKRKLNVWLLNELLGEKSVCDCDGTNGIIQMHTNKLDDESRFMLTVLFSQITVQLLIGTQMQLQYYNVEFFFKKKTPFSSDINTVQCHCAAFHFAAALRVWLGGGDGRHPLTRHLLYIRAKAVRPKCRWIRGEII